MDSPSKVSSSTETDFFSQISVTLGIAIPFDSPSLSSRDPSETDDRSELRLQRRVKRLQEMPVLRKVYNLSGVLKPTPLSFSFEPLKDLNFRGLELIPEDLLQACYKAGHPVPDEFLFLFTGAPLADECLAVIDRSRVALIQENAVRILADRLGRDPLVALIAVLIAKSMTAFNTSQDSSVTRLTVDEALDAIRKGAEDTVFEVMTRDSGFGRAEIDGVLSAEVAYPDLRPTSYADNLAKTDALGFKPFVESFARLILHRETTPPLVIAVTGEWGKGKSSFMRFLRQRLEEHGTDASAGPPGDFLVPRAITVWFDAWRYNSEERVFAALLETVASEIQRRFTPWAWLRYRLRFAIKRQFTWRVAYQLITHALIIPLVLILAATWVCVISNAKQWSVEDFMKAAVTGGGNIGFVTGMCYVAWRILQQLRLPLGLDLNKLYEEKDHSERLGYAAMFKEDFERRLDQLARMPSASLRAPYSKGKPVTMTQSAIKTGDPEYKGNRVVIFVDDLDRCRPDTIVDILEAIRNIFDTTNIVFVLGMDEQYIRAGIYTKYKGHIETQQALYPTPHRSSSQNGGTGLADLWPRRYLEKIIQLPFRLPDAEPDHIKQMVNDLIAVKDKIQGEDSWNSSLTDDEKPRSAAVSPETLQAALAEVDTADVSLLILNASLEVTPAHKANPRRVKSFVNRCRLGLYLMKLQMSDMLPSDYEEALRCFSLWECQAAGLPDSAPDYPGGKLGVILKRLHACIFQVAHDR